MKHYKHILCPVDFSDHSLKTLQQAVALREQTGGKLTVVHFVEPAPVAGYGLGMVAAYNTEEIDDELLQAATKKMHDFIDKMPLSVQDVQVQLGIARHAIPQLTEDSDYDLIVIGSHGQTGFATQLLGSTASSIVNRVSCDVFIVRN